MTINKVISYKNAWNEISSNYQTELAEIVESIDPCVTDYIKHKEAENNKSLGDFWADKMIKKGWNIADSQYYSRFDKRIYLRAIGPIKNGISASLKLGHPDIFNRWFFQHSTLAVKYQVVKIPIYLLPMREIRDRKEMPFHFFTIEDCLGQIQPLTPLSHSYPFLILGYSDQPGTLEIIELEADPLVNNGDIVIDRCIEFPPEYYQAGLNILNYFGTYLREQYPNENAKVKIEQSAQIVRLVIETNDGEKEIVEKALHEYQLIVTGQKKPEEITSNQKLILELNSELRLAKCRIEMQQDIIQVQSGRIDDLLGIIGNGLTNKTPISIDFKPVISLNNHTTIHHEVTYALSAVNDLKQLVPGSSSDYMELQDLEGSLKAIEKEQDPEVVKGSSAMKKLKKVLDSVMEGNTQLSKYIKAAENGWDTFKKLAGKYNKIAEWCGLPQVPSVFTK